MPSLNTPSLNISFAWFTKSVKTHFFYRDITGSIIGLLKWPGILLTFMKTTRL